MNIKIVTAAVAGLVLSIISFANVANAGLIKGTGVIEVSSVDYVEFELTGTSDVDFEIVGDPYSNGLGKWEGYEFYLLKGKFGEFDAGYLDWSGYISSDEQWSVGSGIAGLEAGFYTYAVGAHKFTLDEANSGNASSPYVNSLDYSYTLNTTAVPEPASLALLGLALAGLGFSRRKARS